ncbi:tyrosinase-like protein 1 [Saccostrea echinata]|uniref:tyrosinase-like protein 1 n=1 Tax=Saccostrea echinata TaxID=191078 RepID=UPI002A830038|nr:tyrosinase-like protein 1 [Saccostrea echinata]
MLRIDPFFIATFLGVLGLVHSLLKPIPLPTNLQECYKFRSFNMTPSDSDAIRIQNVCFRNYEYKQIAAGKVWSGPNITQEGINYIDGLFRQIFTEAREVERYYSGRRHKRQIRRPWRYRQEVRSGNAFRRFANCINRLQNQFVEPRDAGRNTYQTLAVFHSGPALDTAHDGPGFTPWHRIYLLLLESACGVPIPYWDSSVDHDMGDPTESVLWSDQFFGNGDGVVNRGPFRNMRTILGGPVIRNIGTGDSALFTKDGVRAVLSRRNYEDIMEPKEGAEYMFSLEGHHNGPHVWVGGHVASLNTAPYDPVFYMHHAFVDAVWERFREQQRANGVNPETDYPATYPDGHGPDVMIDFRPYVNQIPNSFAMLNFIANLVRYEPFPACDNQCNRSPHLRCDRTRRAPTCVSRERRGAPPQMFQAGAASRSAAFSRTATTRSQSLAVAEAAGPIPAGPKFRSSPIRDTRNRASSIGTAPVAPEIQAARAQVRRVVQARVRRDISEATGNDTFSSDNHQSVSSLQRSFTNTFLMDGKVDLKRWVYVPIRIVYTRSPNVDGIDPTILRNVDLSKDSCQAAQSGALKVFVASNGLNYYGSYKEFVIIDERQPVSITTTAVGIKNPDYGEGEVLFTAYDSCGRPCRPLCLTETKGQQKYKACSGAFKISSARPEMYRSTYKDALAGDLLSQNLFDTYSYYSQTPITFACDNNKKWPWEY